MKAFIVGTLLLVCSQRAGAAPTVAVFMDKDYLCTPCTETYNPDVLKGILAGAYSVNAITAVDAASWRTGLTGATALFVPFLYAKALAPDLTADATSALRDFVSSGGHLILQIPDTQNTFMQGLVAALFHMPLDTSNNNDGGGNFTCDLGAATAFGWDSAPATGLQATEFTFLVSAPAGFSQICAIGTSALLSAAAVGDGVVYLNGFASDAAPAADHALLYKEMVESQMVAGTEHTCALRSAGGVACWGNNDNGQLGAGRAGNIGSNAGDMGANLPSVAFGAGFTPAAVATGGRHSCALATNGAVKCWGANRWGELGLGDVKVRGIAASDMGDQLPAVDLGKNVAVTALALGAEFSCALTTTGSVKCWGRNEAGQLGLGDTGARGGATGQMGDALLAVDLGTGHKALALTAGLRHACAVLEDHSVRCWGDGSLGQLGTGQAANVGNAAGQMGDKLNAVALGNTAQVMRLTSGSNHTCALLGDGTIKCWGGNSRGQLGLGDTVTRGDKPNQMGDALPLTDLGRLQVVRDIACGGMSCCAATVQQTLKCWGANSQGQLGLGDSRDRGGAATDMGDQLPFVDLGPAFAAMTPRLGSNYSCVIGEGSVWRCWGGNSDGELGLGDTEDRGGTDDTIPAALPVVGI